MTETPGNSKAVLIVASLALVASLAALGGVVYLAFFRPDPLSGNLDQYNFSTPEAALKSELQMELNGDFLARMEIQRQMKAQALKQSLDTLEIHKVEDWKDKKILYVSFQQDQDQKQHNALVYEQDQATGFWTKGQALAYQIQQDHPELIRRMQHWESTGTLGENSNPKVPNPRKP